MADLGTWALLIALAGLVAFYVIASAVGVLMAVWELFRWAVRRAVR